MPVTVGSDTSKTRRTLSAGGKSVAYYSIPAAEAAGLGTFSNLPAALKVDGGATANDLLCQIQADLLGIAVDRPRVLERLIDSRIHMRIADVSVFQHHAQGFVAADAAHSFKVNTALDESGNSGVAHDVWRYLHRVQASAKGRTAKLLLHGGAVAVMGARREYPPFRRPKYQPLLFDSLD